MTEYATPAAERTYGDAACPEAERNLTTLARWIAKQRPSAVHVRDMQRNIRLPGLVTADAIHAACKALAEAGWRAAQPLRSLVERMLSVLSVQQLFDELHTLEIQELSILLLAPVDSVPAARLRHRHLSGTETIART